MVVRIKMSDAVESVDRSISYYPAPNGSDFGPIPEVTETRCHVCMHPQRIFIQNAAFLGIKHEDIVARLEDPTSLKWWNVRDHFRNGHVPLHQQLVVDTLWARAIKDGVTPEEYDSNRSVEFRALEKVVDKFTTQLNDPSFTPDMKEGMAAVKLLHDLTGEADAGVFDPSDIYVALSLFIAHVNTIFTMYVPAEAQEAMTDLRSLLDNDPVLRVLVAKTQVGAEQSSFLDRREEEPAILEAELVEVTGPRAFIPLDTDTGFDERDDDD
jgi:hypothetical protein